MGGRGRTFVWISLGALFSVQGGWGSLCSTGSGVALLDRALWLDLDMPFGVFRLADLFSAGRAGGVYVLGLM